MSRRFRLEKQQAKEEIKDNLPEEDPNNSPKDIFAPLVWAEYRDGIRIEDMKPKYLDEVTAMLKEYYLVEEVLCRNSNILEDEPSTESIMDKLICAIKNSTTLIAIHKYFVKKSIYEAEQLGIPLEEIEPPVLTKCIKGRTPVGHRYVMEITIEEEEVMIEKLVGVLVNKVVYKDAFGTVFSRVKIYDGEAYQKCRDLTNHMSRKTDVFNTFDCDVFLRLYAFCIIPEYRGKEIGYRLAKGALSAAIAMNIPVVMGLFTNDRLQKLGLRIGMQYLFEVDYVNWLDKDKELVFEDPGAGNYTCATMAGLVRPPSPPRPLSPDPDKEKADNKPVFMTRAQRRAEKVKQLLLQTKF